jgi:hypothetical protein
MYAWVFEYYVTATGFEVRIFKLLPLYRLRKRNIVSPRAINGFFGAAAFGSHPWNTVSMGNRLRRRWVLLEKRCWPRFLAITPAEPDVFVAALDLHGE